MSCLVSVPASISCGVSENAAEVDCGRSSHHEKTWEAHLLLDGTPTGLRSGTTLGCLLGGKIYLVHVVEFQKRGLPHAHLTFLVEPQPLTTDEIDQVISAEVSPASDNKEDQRCRELVLRHMVHCHTRACLDDNGACQRNYQKPLMERTYINDRGYVHYRRHSEEGRMVVPHNRHLLLLAESHINVEVSCYSPTVLPSNCPTVLLSHSPSVLLLHCPSVPTSFCFTVPLSYNITVPLTYCLTVPLFICLTVPLSYSLTVPLSY